MSATKDFENNLKRLEAIVTALEKEEQSLEDTVKLFQEGVNLSKECRKALQEVEKSVKQVMEEDRDGNITTSDLKTDEYYSRFF